MPGEGSSLLIGADAGARMGTGHVMRCLALGQTWQDAGGPVVFVTAPGTAALEGRLGQEGFQVRHMTAEPGGAEDASLTAGLAESCGAEWVVVDGYQFDAAYQGALRRENLRLLVVDDKGHAGEYVADLVLNQNLHAQKGLYSRRGAGTRLLLGTDYVMLRREFRRRIGHRPNISESARKILVTLGGADPKNHSGTVLKALGLAETPGVEATVVVGPSNRNKEALEDLVSTTRCPAELVFGVENMAELMAAADLAICTGGATVWELAFMGVPAVVGTCVDVEQRLVEGLKKIGLYVHLGWFDAVDPQGLAKMVDSVCQDAEARRSMSRLGQDLVDGRGVERVLAAMSQVTGDQGEVA